MNQPRSIRPTCFSDWLIAEQSETLPRKRAAFLGRTVVKNDQFVALPLPYLL
jgi:hypothetical protein